MPRAFSRLLWLPLLVATTAFALDRPYTGLELMALKRLGFNPGARPTQEEIFEKYTRKMRAAARFDDMEYTDVVIDAYRVLSERHEVLESEISELKTALDQVTQDEVSRSDSHVREYQGPSGSPLLEPETEWQNPAMSMSSDQLVRDEPVRSGPIDWNYYEVLRREYDWAKKSNGGHGGEAFAQALEKVSTEGMNLDRKKKTLLRLLGNEWDSILASVSSKEDAAALSRALATQDTGLTEFIITDLWKRYPEFLRFSTASELTNFYMRIIGSDLRFGYLGFSGFNSQFSLTWLVDQNPELAPNVQEFLKRFQREDAEAFNRFGEFFAENVDRALFHIFAKEHVRYKAKDPQLVAAEFLSDVLAFKKVLPEDNGISTKIDRKILHAFDYRIGIDVRTIREGKIPTAAAFARTFALEDRLTPMAGFLPFYARLKVLKERCFRFFNSERGKPRGN